MKESSSHNKSKVTDPSVTVTFSLKKSLLEAIEQEALKTGIAKSQIIVNCLRRGLRERGIDV